MEQVENSIRVIPKDELEQNVIKIDLKLSCQA